MNHLNEQQLVLYYYGEETEGGALREIEAHLGECDSCRGAYHGLQRVLNSVDSLPVPERPADYEAQVWSSVSKRVPMRRAFFNPASRLFSWNWFSWKPMLAAAAMAAMVAVAFLAGRGSLSFRNSGRNFARGNGNDPQVAERVLLVAVGDHLQRSQTMLIELANAGTPKGGSLDISYEQHAAQDLLEANRLYQQTAATTGDASTAAMLDELERVFLEIAHSPSSMSGRQLEDLRKQIEDRGIIFKVKVFGSEVEKREAAPAGSATSL
ncbi:MAG TPA: hypothetical protein VKS01_03640 [Bryobacteraceae bacterium]|nr:hypothetical protein [Bryobacteraceae bacterium]